MTIIAIDAMGGDHGPPTTIPAAIHALNQYPNLHLILVGDDARLNVELAKHTYDTSRLTIQHASQHVTMDELPSHALRSKKDSSMRVAINLVKEGKAKACVSAGNTGALMATARFVLKTLPGIDRPAIISSFPVYEPNKKVRMLDLGANVDSTSADLLQFAVMGSVLAKSVDQLPSPRVYLLNIGEEEIKGNEQVKAAAQLLSRCDSIHYCGYIEADALYSGIADVVVCDGFVGNVTLKNTEGVAKFIGLLIKDAFSKSWYTKLMGLLVKPILKPVMKRIDPGRYNGATFVGLNGIVIKSHGGASVLAFARAIEEAMLEVKNNIPERIRNEVETVLKQSSSSQG